jgi:predicted TIM-barrel fold metal-dependent hydrolase
METEMATQAIAADQQACAGFKVISADNHVNEPRDLFTSRFPKHLQDKAPRVMEGADGGEGWSWNGSPPRRTYGLEAMAGFDKKDYRMSGLKFEQLRKGNYIGSEHLKDMDMDGIAASVCYPGSAASLYTQPDREVAEAGFVAYNDWIIDDFQSADPKRLCGLAFAPTELGIEYAVTEMRRAVKKGARAFYIPGNPVIPYNHPTHYEPIWQIADEFALTLCMHRNHGGPPDATDWDRLDEDKVSIGGIVTRYFSCARPFSYLIFAGIFDRYPNLKMVGAEVDCGWVPFWVQTMMHHWEIQQSWHPVKLKVPPIEFIGRNVFTTNVDDYCGYQMITTGLWPWLSGMTMFSSDYPHSATIWPNSRAVAEKMTVGMKDDDKRKCLSENAVRVFGFDI